MIVHSRYTSGTNHWVGLRPFGCLSRRGETGLLADNRPGLLDRRSSRLQTTEASIEIVRHCTS